MTARFVLLIGIYVVLNSIAQILLKLGASATSSWTLLGLPINGRLMLGVGLFGLSFVIWIVILSRENLSYAFPFAVGLGYSTVVLLAVLVLREQVTTVQMVGIGVVLAGLTMIASGN